MSSQKLKKRLQQDLRTKRHKKKRLSLVVGLLLIALLIGSGALLWNSQRPAVLLQQGIQLEQQTQLEAALERFRALYEDYPARQEAAEALFRSGQILQHDLGKSQLALINYLLLEKDYPQSRLLPAARREAAELTKFRLKNCDQAIPVYQRIIENAEEQADSALYEIADCYARQKNWRQAAIEFDTLMANDPQSPLKQWASYRRADALLLSGRHTEALQGFEMLVKESPQSEAAEEARFRLAEMLEKEGRLRDALQAYSKLTRYPRQDLLKQKIIRLKERMARKKKGL